MPSVWPWLISSLVATMVPRPAGQSPPPAGADARASGARGRGPAARVEEHRPLSALSVGSPNEGRLVGGVALEPGRYIRIVPAYASTGARWGLPALVELLDRAARRVAARYPGAVTSVGDLSRRGGGDLDRHHSHESGRDADVAFFVRGETGKPLAPQKFVSFGAAGTAPAWPGAHFDDARNWAFVAALLDDPSSRVTHIFVSAPLRARLLRYAESIGAPRDLRDRAALVLMQPHGAPPHDDHFHVRIGCPAGQSGECIELATTYRAKGRGVLVARARNRSGRGASSNEAGAARVLTSSSRSGPAAAPESETGAPPTRSAAHASSPAPALHGAVPGAERVSRPMSDEETGLDRPRFVPASMTVRFATHAAAPAVCAWPSPDRDELDPP